MTKPFTGRKFLAVTVGFFAVIFAVNFYMMYRAVSGFPGLVVKSSYQAGVGFDERRAAQEALGWRMQARYEDGGVLVRMSDRDGAPLQGLSLRATIGRPATDVEDREVAFAAVAEGYRGPTPLAPGRWSVMLKARDGRGRKYEARAEIYVEPDS